MWDPGWEIESRRPRFYRCYICTWPRALMCTVQHTPTARQASQDANARQLLLLATRVQGCALILRALYRVYLKFTGFVGQRHNLLMMIRNTHRTQIGRGPYLPQHPSSHPKSAMGFWMTRVRRANDEFSAHFPSRGKAKNSSRLPMTASAFGSGVFGRL